MKNKNSFTIIAILSLTLLLCLLPGVSPQEAAAEVIRPFTTRFKTNVNGEIYLIGNVNLHAGAEVAGNNNDYPMLNVDIDGNATTFNSSSANFTLPPGASILWAGLYWGADTEGATQPPDMASRDRVRFNTGSGYQTIISQIPLDQNTGGYRYQGFAEVTNLISSQSAGTTRTYTTANIQAATNSGPSHYAGWSLVVAIYDPAEVLRHLNIFDGFAQIDPTTPSVTTNVAGFRTPLVGAFNTHVSMVAYEGDLTSTGDSFLVNGFSISNTLNPINNFFNSSITRKNVRVSAKNPDYINQLGFDIDTVDVPYTSGIIPNGATSANLTFAMTGDWYYPGVLTFAIDIYDPVLQGNISKSMIDLNGGALYGDDIVEFVIRLGNTGNDNATNVVLTDPIPPGTTYVPGSLVITEGANLGVKTDASGDDQANFDAGNNRVVFRMGSGANAVNGGTIGIGVWTEARFRVKINTGVPNGTTISNSATVDFIGENSGLPFTSTSNLYEAVAGLYCDLQTSKSVADTVRAEGQTTTFTITVHNSGPDNATDVVVTDVIPAGFLLQSATTTQGSYNSGSGLWTVGTLNNGATATLTLVVEIASGASSLTQPLSNTATASARQIDTDLTNNTASATLTAYLPSDLSTSTKSWVDLNGGDQEPDDQLTYTITLINTGPGNATGVSVTDDIPANVNSFALVSTPAGANSSSTTYSGTGTNSNGYLDIRNITVPAGGSVTIVYNLIINSGALPGLTIDNSAVITNPNNPGGNPAAPQITVSSSMIPGSGTKNLYLYGTPGRVADKLSRTINTSTDRVDFSTLGTQTWTMNPVAAADITIDPAVSPTVPVWLRLRRANTNGNRTIKVDLQCSSGGPILSNTRVINLNANETNYDFYLAAAPPDPAWTTPITCSTGNSWVLTVSIIANTRSDGMRLYFDNTAANRSRVELPASTVINVDSITYYDAPYPAGNVMTSVDPGETVYIRTVVSDPFGSYDINASNTLATRPDITITNPSGTTVVTADMTELVALTTASTKTFEYSTGYTIPAAGPTGNWLVRVDAVEGTEGTVTDLGLKALLVPAPLPNLLVLKSADRARVNSGEIIIYTITSSNSGPGVATAVKAIDNLSPYVSLILDYDGVTPPFQPFDFVPSSSGLTTGIPSYFDSNGLFTPNFTAGEDGSVTRWELPLTGNFSAGGDFTLRFKVRVK